MYFILVLSAEVSLHNRLKAHRLLVSLFYVKFKFFRSIKQIAKRGGSGIPIVNHVKAGKAQHFLRYFLKSSNAETDSFGFVRSCGIAIGVKLRCRQPKGE